MAINTLPTIISIIKNGTNIKNPIWNAVFNSLIAKAGTTTYKGILSSVNSSLFDTTSTLVSFGLSTISQSNN